jgi:hypothetical protein
MKASFITVCWEFLQFIVTWCILTTAAIYRLDACDDAWLLARGFCLFAYYGWALASTMILLPSHVQSHHSSVNITTITAIVLLFMSLLNHSQLHKHTATRCSRQFQQIPLIKAWLATAVTTYYLEVCGMY